MQTFKQFFFEKHAIPPTVRVEVHNIGTFDAKADTGNTYWEDLKKLIPPELIDGEQPAALQLVVRLAGIAAERE